MNVKNFLCGLLLGLCLLLIPIQAWIAQLVGHRLGSGVVRGSNLWQGVCHKYDCVDAQI